VGTGKVTFSTIAGSSTAGGGSVINQHVFTSGVPIPGANRCASPYMYFIKANPPEKRERGHNRQIRVPPVICWLKQTRWTVIGIVLAGLCHRCTRSRSQSSALQYVREQWTTESRFPGGAVNGIAQTADGYLWIGTDRGLIRFDGLNFRPVSFTSITTALNITILQLLTDARGTLWIRPEGAYLVSQKDGEFSECQIRFIRNHRHVKR